MNIEKLDFKIRLVDGNSKDAEPVKEMIAGSFRRRLGASPILNHKRYLAVETNVDGQTALAAAASITFASEQALFSEKYLFQPLEQVVSDQLGLNYGRGSICEIGSVATNPRIIRSVKLVVGYFPWFGRRFGCDVALVTVTSYMRESLSLAGVNFNSLVTADPNKLTIEERLRWGDYYDYEPQTGTIDLSQLDFLDSRAIPGDRSNEMKIQLGVYAEVVA